MSRAPRSKGCRISTPPPGMRSSCPKARRLRSCRRCMTRSWLPWTRRPCRHDSRTSGPIWWRPSAARPTISQNSWSAKSPDGPPPYGRAASAWTDDTMATLLAQQRKTRLTGAMAEAGLDLLVVYGNAWQNDYLRYATDFGILEGQALAVVRTDGQVTLYLDSPIEVDRAQIDCPSVEVIHAPDLVGEVDGALDRFRNQRIGAAPQRLIPRRIAARSQELTLSDQTSLIDRLLMA